MELSVVIVGRNVQAYIQNCLHSVVPQLSAQDEVIYWDDASQDDSFSIAQKYLSTAALQTHYQIYQGPSKLGPAEARNSANTHANGRWIVVLDADDLLTSDSLSTIRSTLQKNPAVDLLLGDIIEVDDESKTKKIIQYPDLAEARCPLFRIFSHPRIPFKHSGMTLSRQFFKKISGYRTDLKHKIDVDLVLRCFENRARVFKVHTPLAEHRLHAMQISKRRLEGIKAYRNILQSSSLPWHQRLLALTLRSFFEILKAGIGR